MDIHTLQYHAWVIAEVKGHHASLDALPVREQSLIRLALLHTEVSEATQIIKRQGVTEDNRGAIAEELADVLIRLGDLAECLDIDLSGAAEKKLEKNRGRPYAFGTPREHAILLGTGHIPDDERMT